MSRASRTLRRRLDRTQKEVVKANQRAETAEKALVEALAAIERRNLIIEVLRDNVQEIVDQMASNHADYTEERRRSDLELQTDSLTGLPNRRAWDGAWARDKDNLLVAVLASDLDNFGKVNKYYANMDPGDELLKKMARSYERAIERLNSAHPGLSMSLRSVFRMGGDEVRALVHIEHAHELARLVTEEFEREPNIFPGHIRSFRVTISVGVGLLEDWPWYCSKPMQRDDVAEAHMVEVKMRRKPWNKRTLHRIKKLRLGLKNYRARRVGIDKWRSPQSA